MGLRASLSNQAVGKGQGKSRPACPVSSHYITEPLPPLTSTPSLSTWGGAWWSLGSSHGCLLPCQEGILLAAAWGTDWGSTQGTLSGAGVAK